MALGLLDTKDMRVLHRITESDRNWKRLTHALKGIQVQVTVGPRGRSERSRPIKKLEMAASAYEFLKDGHLTTVEV